MKNFERVSAFSQNAGLYALLAIAFYAASIRAEYIVEDALANPSYTNYQLDQIAMYGGVAIIVFRLLAATLAVVAIYNLIVRLLKSNQRKLNNFK